MAFFKMREVSSPSPLKYIFNNEFSFAQMFFEDNIDNDKYSGHLFGLSFQTDRTAASE